LINAKSSILEGKSVSARGELMNVVSQEKLLSKIANFLANTNIPEFGYLKNNPQSQKLRNSNKKRIIICCRSLKLEKTLRFNSS